MWISSKRNTIQNDRDRIFPSECYCKKFDRNNSQGSNAGPPSLILWCLDRRIDWRLYVAKIKAEFFHISLQYKTNEYLLADAEIAQWILYNETHFYLSNEVLVRIISAL